MAYGTARTTVQTLIVNRLNDSGTGVEAAWSTTQIDNAIGEALRMAEPCGVEDIILMTATQYGATPQPQPVTPILQIKTAEILNRYGQATPLPPAQLQLVKTSAFQWLVLRNGGSLGADETISLTVVRQLDPADTVITTDVDMIVHYAIAYLYTLYVTHGQASERMQEQALADLHRQLAEQRKSLILTQQYFSGQGNPAAAPPAAPASGGGSAPSHHGGGHR